MDIAKIRKKAKEQGAGKVPETPAAPLPPGPEVIAPVERGEKDVPLDGAHGKGVQTPGPEMTDALHELPEDEACEETHGQVELLTFRLGSEEFAFRVENVEEIVRMQKITMVPTVPSYVTGVTSLRGKIIPVIDLKARLNLGKTAEAVVQDDDARGKAAQAKILIIDGQRGFIGAIVDRVVGVVRLSRQEVLEPPAHLSEAEKKYIEGIVILEKRFISVVRPEDAMDTELG